MPRKGTNPKEAKGDVKAVKPGFKVRTTNDLQLVSMILDEDPLLREKVLRLMEQQLGKRQLVKAGGDSN
jgi:hypothetical protein